MSRRTVATLTSLTVGRQYRVHGGDSLTYTGRDAYGAHLFRDGAGSLAMADALLGRMMQRGEIVPASAAPTIVHVCAWCGNYRSEIDRMRAERADVVQESHGLCDGCQTEHFGEVEA